MPSRIERKARRRSQDHAVASRGTTPETNRPQRGRQVQCPIRPPAAMIANRPAPRIARARKRRRPTGTIGQDISPASTADARAVCTARGSIARRLFGVERRPRHRGDDCDHRYVDRSWKKDRKRLSPRLDWRPTRQIATPGQSMTVERKANSKRGHAKAEREGDQRLRPGRTGRLDQAGPKNPWQAPQGRD